jgi:hypothetical protein
VEMHKEKYEELLRRFSQELHEVGVNDNLKGLVQDQADRTPNVISASAEEISDRFIYRHDGYIIEAIRTVKLIVKTTK